MLNSPALSVLTCSWVLLRVFISVLVCCDLQWGFPVPSPDGHDGVKQHLPQGSAWSAFSHHKTETQLETPPLLIAALYLLSTSEPEDLACSIFRCVCTIPSPPQSFRFSRPHRQFPLPLAATLPLLDLSHTLFFSLTRTPPGPMLQPSLTSGDLCEWQTGEENLSSYPDQRSACGRW